MARFYGTIQGARGPASRLGNGSSGLTVTAQSFNGDICVHFGTSSRDPNRDHVNVYARTHAGSFSHWQQVSIFSGFVDDLLGVNARTNLVKDQVAKLSVEEKIELYHELGRALLAHPNSYAALED